MNKTREDYDPELVKQAEEHEYHKVLPDAVGYRKQCPLCYLKSNLQIEENIKNLQIK